MWFHQAINDYHSDLAIPADWGVSSSAFEKMKDMGLGELPLQTIALPQSNLSLDERPLIPTILDVKQRFCECFPGYLVALLYEMQSLCNRLEVQAYVIGGIPRDMLLQSDRDLATTDVDITVEGDAIAVSEQIVSASNNFVLLQQYPQFGTARLRYKDQVDIDMASTRSEVYSRCGVVPTVVRRAVPLAEDLLRRDFTINTLALSINRLGQLVDHLGGLGDLARQSIRILSPVSFFEDPSRLLRAMRFACRFGFHLSDDTLILARQFMKHGRAVYKGGGERIYEELTELLSQVQILPEVSVDTFREVDVQANLLPAAPSYWIKECLELKLFSLVHMDAEVDWAGHQAAWSVYADRLQGFLPLMSHWRWETTNAPYDLDDVIQQTWLCWILSCFPDVDTAVHRLGLNRVNRHLIEVYLNRLTEQTNPFDALLSQHDPSSSDVYQQLNGLPLPVLLALLIEALDRISLNPTIGLATLAHYWLDLRDVKSLLDGTSLLDLGIPEGPEMGQIMQLLVRAQITEQINNRIQAIGLVETWLKQKKAYTNPINK